MKLQLGIVFVLVQGLVLIAERCFAEPIVGVVQPLVDGWTGNSPREEICPSFDYSRSETGWTFAIQQDSREGLDGWIEKRFDVDSGAYYRFEALRKLHQVANPRRSALVRIRWLDANGAMVLANVSKEQQAKLGHHPTAEPEHPVDGLISPDGWCSVSGVYRAPEAAAQAVVELHLQWAPHGKVEWSEIRFKPTEAPTRRTVKLAAIHYRPSGKSSRVNCEEYAPLIRQAASEGADLVVLGETVPSVNVGLPPHEVAEPIPGPSTDYFASLSKESQTHIVVSLYERDRHLIYNTAILLGPEGTLLGKYRKVCLPHGEVEQGIAPGEEYPVFDTSIGKIGMMICYDGFFPEVARELSNRGAEIIAWPVWGCNPKLAAARACENHVFVVSSTFMAPEEGWMISAVFDRNGEPIAQGKQWNTIALAEVELGQPYIGPWNLGDFRSMIDRHRPLDPKELELHRSAALEP